MSIKNMTKFYATIKLNDGREVVLFNEPFRATDKTAAKEKAERMYPDVDIIEITEVK